MASFQMPKGLSLQKWNPKDWLSIISISIIIVEALIGATIDSGGTVAQRAIRIAFHLVLGFAGAYLGRNAMAQVLQGVYTIILFIRKEVKSVAMIFKEAGEAILSLMAVIYFPWWLFLYISRGLGESERITSYSISQLLIMAPMNDFHLFTFMMCGTIIMFYAGYLCNIGLSFMYLSGASRQTIITNLLQESKDYVPLKEMLAKAKLSKDEKKEEKKPSESPVPGASEEEKKKVAEVIEKNAKEKAKRVMDEFSKKFMNYKDAIINKTSFKSAEEVAVKIEGKPNPQKYWDQLARVLAMKSGVYQELMKFLNDLEKP